MRRIRYIALSGLLASACAFSATAASSPTPGPTAGNLLQVLMGLIVVLGLMAAAAWMLRRVNTSRWTTGAPIKIIGGINVGTRERVVVVEVADQWIVVGVAPGRVNALATLPKQEAIVSTETVPARNFSSWLTQIIEKRNAQ